MSNNVEITDVILNRGRCTAPKAHTQKDIEALNEYRNKLEPSKRGLSFFDDGRPMVAFSERRPVFVGPQEYQEPAARVALDPRRKYEFGDTVNIALFDCDHLIEFTIEANGKNWTWKTH